MSISRKLGRHVVEQVDRPRLREGFIALAANQRRWPAPIDLIDAMPPRPVVKSLDVPPMSDGEQKKGLLHLAEIRARLEAKMGA